MDKNGFGGLSHSVLEEKYLISIKNRFYVIEQNIHKTRTRLQLAQILAYKIQYGKREGGAGLRKSFTAS